ncbi:hypothetical protein FGW37_05400 [Streptomyces rectiverticillatus]|uniref:transglycosylase SLT domain-containing protein n=1 Tax=Streptomyces rectiverticillatus TaxID=173860 RepID=UPI0015C313EE|nr:transglycosylase SLT domain-containing protein [Streptomyces rectiverticillatus]QLE71112.1 hypothetical protein FGW37_05400 [Streptomyces rectiverticillatus]
MASTRGPIKVGSGYIEIIPKLSQTAVSEFRGELTKQMQAAGAAAGREFSRSAEAGMDGLPRAAAAAAKRASSAVQREARDTEASLSAIERQITREYGAQAGARFREAQRLEAEKRKLLEGTSAATRTAARQVVAEEGRAASESATRWRVAEQGRIEMIRLREREAIRAERAQAAAAVQAQREIQAAIRARVLNELAALQSTRQSLQTQIREHQAAMRQMQTYNGSFFSNFQRGWKRAGEDVHRFGTQATETGRLITHNLIGPVGLLAAGLTAVGVKSADSLMQAQSGLHGMGLELRDVNQLLKEMQKYAIQTPYSLQDMQKYSTRYARALASHDEDFQSSDPERKRKGSKRVAAKAGDIVEMIGDQAAYGGIMDPHMVSQGMYATEVILDMGRTPMRNMKQLERATGIPANELARMYGFKDRQVKDPQNPGKTKKQTASAQMYEFMADAKNTGGIEGSELIDKLLERWGDKKNGIQGSAARMGSATISGRIQQMKESGQVALGKLFYSENKDGSFEYTGLGKAIMGERGKDRKFEGGILNEAKGIGRTALKLTPELLEEFFSVLGTFTDWIRSTVDFLDEHPGLRDAVLEAAKIAAVAAPFLIAFGLLTKGVGKLAKLMNPAIGVVQGVAQGGRGLIRTSRQVLAGQRAQAGGGSFRDGYRSRRAELRGGDDRGLIRRGADRFMGRNSQQVRVQADTAELERQLREVNARIDALKASLREVNNVQLQDVSNAIGSDAGRSIRAAARDAEGALRQVRTQGTDPLNRERLELVTQAVEGLKERAQAAERRIREAAAAVEALNGRTTGSVRQEFSYLSQKAETADSRARDVYNRITDLNQRPLKALRQEFDWTEPKVREVRRAIQEAIDRMTTLNGKPLASLRDKFKGGGNSLYSAVDSVNGKLSTTNSRLREINGARVGDATRSVNSLKGALEKAAEKADDLDDNIGKVNNATGRGGGGVANKNRTKKALGGILPGYAPGVDSIPALLSPGEAILRPEVAHRLGPSRIDAWNAAAARGHLSRYAMGTSGAGKLPFFNGFAQQREVFDISQIVSLYGSSVGFMSTAHGIGGRTGRNVADWGAQAGGGSAGSGASSKFRGIVDWFSNDMPDLLRRTPTGMGQLIGIIAGAIAPSAGKYFWDDIWKGEGNLAERSGDFLGDMLNPESLWQMVKDLVTGVWDSVKAIVQTAVSTVTDPKGAFLEAVDEVKEMVTEPLDQLKDTFAGLQEIAGNPGEYAKQVWDEFYQQAKEAMPNTKGLWDFAAGGIVPGYSPGRDVVHARLSPGEAVLRPDAVRALGYRTILSLNRTARTGTPATRLDASEGGEAAPANSSVTPVPDAAAVEDAAARIAEAFASMAAAIEAAVQREQAAMSAQAQALRSHQSASDTAWSAIAGKVRSAIDAEIQPAQQRWVQHLQGPLTQAEKSFQSANSASWSDIQSKVAGSTSSVLGSFAGLRGGLSNLRSFFQAGASEIRSVWESSMSYVDSSTRSTISGPYNRGTVPMMAAMANLAGADQPLSPVHFSTGGIVPGYLPGIDKVPAVLSPGEGILRPEVVRALGRDRILEWNEAARRGRNVFARGGIVRPLTGSTGDGGAWVRKHQDDPYSGYFEAIAKGWPSTVKPGLDEVSSAFRVAGKLEAQSFGKALPWLQKLGKYWDDHLGGGGRVVEVARREFTTEAPAVGGAKYTGGSFEAWCADFISYVVDQAGANAQYGGSPHGAPANRWPAVAQWNAAMRHVPVSEARPGDLLTYGGDAHINLMVGPDETIGGNESNRLKHTRGYARAATAALRPTGAVTDSGPAFKPWPGSIPKTLFDGGGGVGSGQLTEWITAAMRLTGVSGSQWLQGLVTLVMRESGGDPRAVNNWDSNAQAGTPSKGLGQVIDPTFQAYHQAGTSWDVFDPIANLSSVINYIRGRYGDISNVQQANPNLPPKGYWTGTRSATAGLALVGERGPELVNFHGGERVYSNTETRDLLGNRYEIHVHEATAEDSTQAVMRAMQYLETMHGF